ncbi:MAG: VCBS repeat-containing protein [Bryobacteraceae bacterium]|nr:VCBS repeat-containing protein [Bryobacteraceae bacterium]
MRLGRTWAASLAPAGLGLLLLAAADSSKIDSEKLARIRNLGKAFFENPTTKKEAVEELRKAHEMAPNSARDRLNYGLALLSAGQTKEGVAEVENVQKQDPTIPHTWFVLGIEYKRLGEFDKATRQFEQMVKLVPDEPISHYNLGVLFKMAERTGDAIRKFELTARLNPNLAAPHFQLFNIYRQQGDKDKAAVHLEHFRRLKDQQKGAVIPEDMEWSFYSELYDVVDPKADAAEAAPVELKFNARKLPATLDPKTAGLLVFDADADGLPDLLAWSSKGIALYLKGQTRAPMPEITGVISAAAGDYDNDGLADLCLATETGAVLLKNMKGRFEKQAGLQGGRFEKVVWLDYDHDNDLDLFLLGAKSTLMRNEGSAGFAERSADFPFAKGKAIDAVVFRMIPDTKMQDLVVSYADSNGVLYRDNLAGVYEAVSLKEMPAGANSLMAADVDNNGWIDVGFSTGQKTTFLLGGEGGWSVSEAGAAGFPALADLENRARLDLLAGGKVFRNTSQGRFEPGKPAAGLSDAVAWATADFDADGRLDVAYVAADGAAAVARNESAIKNNWMRIALSGVKAPKLAPGAEVEVKAGTRYQKRTYDGVPLLFGLRSDAAVDTVRITWPNGLIQNELKQPVNQSHSYKEEERLTGSCPMIWSWNGREFQFITDVLGVAPLGASSGDGDVFPTDHDEYIQIPGEALAPRDGKYEIRITEELAEVAYLDQVKLIAVDRPADVDVFTNDKFQAPPFPPFRLFGVKDRTYPVAARDGAGSDVTARLRARDRRYPDGFRRNRSGSAELHALELDFGNAAPGNDAVLVANGWVDWADGSTFRSRSQEKDGGLAMPYLQVKDADGEWRTVIEEMGIPAGKPKTIVVDLAGKFLTPARQVRIVTNLCLYWDEIFLAENGRDPQTQLTALTARSAEIRFRGFSQVQVHPERKQPEMFLYPRPRPASNWNPTRGLYTRYGPVEELLRTIDDRFVIMGSGDEVRLLFDAEAFPPLKAGWKRDFLLFVDGWAKDSDANTAYSQTVEPLPFHGMSAYPYSDAERYPDTPEHRLYREEYNTRPALRLLRPLAGSQGDATRDLGASGGRPVPAASD